MIDLDYLTLTIWGEARGEPIEGKIAVACVIRNRLRTGRWGQFYRDVVTAPAQFSCWAPAGGTQNYQSVMGLRGRLDAGHAIDDPVFVECRWVADGVSRGLLRDTTGGSTHYFEVHLLPPPTWAKGLVPQARIGNHFFFTGVA